MWMIAYIKINFKEGISKKVLYQAQALSILKDNCTLLCLDENENIQCIKYMSGAFESKELICEVAQANKINKLRVFINIMLNQMRDSQEDIYIRHMIPTFELLHFLKKYRNNKIYYEIPTYPYFYEQYTISNNKIKTMIRLFYELCYWPFIYSKVTKLIVIPCRTKIKKLKKMVCITNGCGDITTSINLREFTNNNINMVGIGTIQKYHGYEKIIESIAKYKGEVKIKFCIIGNGDIDSLKKLVNKYSLNEIVEFKGLLSGEELEKEYKNSNLGIGTMSLELRNADIDTGIKVIEYYTQGLPVLSSGSCPNLMHDIYNEYMIVNDEINFDKVYEWLSFFTIEKRKRLARLSRKELSWLNIYTNILGKE